MFIVFCICRAAAAGAPFHVTEIATQKRFLAQLRALDESLARNIEMQNNLDHPGIIQLHQAIMDQGIAVLIYEKYDFKWHNEINNGKIPIQL